jgi:rubrerythrin
MSRKRITVEKAISCANERGYDLISTDIPNSKSLVDWRHRFCGFVFPMSYNNFNAKHGCPKCAVKARYVNIVLNIDIARQRGLERNLELISTRYDHSKASLDWRHTSCGTIFDATLNDISADKSCPTCAGNEKLTIEIARTRGFIKGYKLISPNYSGIDHKMDWECLKCLFLFPMSLHDIDGDHGCPKCALKYNKWEDAFFAKLLVLFPYLKPRAKGFLKNKRFHTDIWDPNNRKALELDGDHWHDRPIQAESDARKNQEYADANIQLLRIKYSEFKKDPESSYQKAVAFLTTE